MILNSAENVVLLSELRVLLNKVIRKKLAEGLLFSVGTDTSIIAYEALKYKPDLKAIKTFILKSTFNRREVFQA